MEERISFMGEVWMFSGCFGTNSLQSFMFELLAFVNNYKYAKHAELNLILSDKTHPHFARHMMRQ
jgi:hypothetical protein